MIHSQANIPSPQLENLRGEQALTAFCLQSFRVQITSLRSSEEPLLIISHRLAERHHLPERQSVIFDKKYFKIS
jgi:hypothetical protein